ncbi:MAG: dihydrofolate reductase [Acidobacteria bacterium]|nr:MAG: dihydrofolate reductase [Acidobacteriota bacterium]
MRRLRYSVAATLDGFIADPDGGYDWIIMDEAIDFARTFEEFDTFVMGRKTWEVSAQTDFVQMFGGKEVIVFSRTLQSPPHPGVKLVNTSPVDTVRELKQKPGKDIWLFGGGSLFRTLVDAGLVDTVEVGIMPVLLSQGIQLLPAGDRITGLKLESCETLPKSGIVMLSYSIPPSARPKPGAAS